MGVQEKVELEIVSKLKEVIEAKFHLERWGRRNFILNPEEFLSEPPPPG